MTGQIIRPAVPALVGRVGSVLLQRAHLVRAGGWVFASYAAQQVLRLVTSVALAWLLAPALLGTMLLINTLRTAGELLTDVGIGQSIVHNERGDQPDFYNTAWTIQIIRGFALFVLALIVTIPVANLYDDPQLRVLLPIVASIFVVSGFTSPAKFLLQKRVAVRALAIYSFTIAVTGSVIHIALAWWLRDIWALIWGLVLSTIITVALSFFLLDWRKHRLKLDRDAVRSILHFGKWIFLSSLIFFAAGNFDRLYLADMVPFAVLGVYGIARTLSETAVNLFTHLSSQLVFPKIAASKARGPALRDVIGSLRQATIWAIALALAAGVAVADTLILWMYDDRYAQAAVYLPILMAGAWFGTLAAIAESVLMGIGKPRSVAFGNAAKFLCVLVTVPLVLPAYGMTATVIVFATVEIVRYAVLGWQLDRERIAFHWQDILATIGFVTAALAFRVITGWLGLNDGLAGWTAILGNAFGN